MLNAHRESFKICCGCGEIYDANTEAESIHHGQSGEHDPLLPPREPWVRRAKVMMLARTA